MIPENDKFLGELRLGRQITSTGQVIAMGTAVIAGLIYILITGPTADIGPTRAMVAVLLAALVFALTLASALELLGGSGERAGTYSLVAGTLGGVWAFLAGWSILATSLAIAGALLRTAADQIALLLNAPDSRPLIAIVLMGLLLLVQILQLLPRLTRRRLVVAGTFLLLFLGILGSQPAVSLESALLVPGGELEHLVRSIAWLMAGFAAFEAILVSRQDIQEPGRRLAAGMIGILAIGSLLLAGAFFLDAWLAQGGLMPAERLPGLLPPPGWFLPLAVFLACVLAGKAVLMMGLRQIHAFSRAGVFPQELRRVYGPLGTPPALFGALALAVLPFLLWGSPWQWTELAAAMFLVTMILLNIAAIYSRRTEPDRRRLLVLPFSPLIPALAIGVNAVLLLALPSQALGSGAVWFGIGLLYYFAYARSRQTAAKVGESVFGRLDRPREQKSGYRIIVPIGEDDERRLVLSLAVALAHQMNGEVIPLQVIPVPDPLAIEEGRRIAAARNVFFKWSMRKAEQAGVPTFPITRLARSIPDGIIDTAREEHCDLILLSWDASRQKPRSQLTSILDAIARRATSDMAILAYHPDQIRAIENTDPDHFEIRRVLVPTAGGPHAPLATRLAVLLSQEYDAVVRTVYVVSDEATEEDVAQGNDRIEQTLQEMHQQAANLPKNGRAKFASGIHIESQVVQADGVVSGISQAGQDCDLIMIGASETSVIDQVLFGNIPEQVSRQSATPVLLVRRYQGLRRFWLQRVWDTVYRALPQVTAEQQIEVYRQLHGGARPRVDYFILMGLSAVIATFGLLQNSTAVIIGAMLVAPLFTPLMALSMAIVRGNVKLLRLAVESMLKGIAAAIAIAYVFTSLGASTTITSEITARTAPNLLDLGVALAAGVVGAYAVSRDRVAAALPGVAIAAALMPPLAVIGIGIGVGDLSIAGGASLLVATNLIAIALGGAVTLVLLGFRPIRHGQKSNWRTGWASALILFLLITISLLAFSVQSFRSTQTRQTVLRSLQQEIEAYPALELTSSDGVRIQNRQDRLEVTVPVYLRGDIEPQVASQLSDTLTETIGRPVWVRLVLNSVVEPER